MEELSMPECPVVIGCKSYSGAPHKAWGITDDEYEKKTLFVIAFKTWLLSYTAVVFEVASFAGNPGHTRTFPIPSQF